MHKSRLFVFDVEVMLPSRLQRSEIVVVINFRADPLVWRFEQPYDFENNTYHYVVPCDLLIFCILRTETWRKVQTC